MSTFYNDGGFVNFGSALLSVTGLNGVLVSNYITENLTITFPSEVIEIRNQQNGPLGQIMVSGFANGSATFQCGTSGQVMPHNGCTFGFNNGVYIVSEVGDTRTQADIAKAAVSFRRKIN